MKEYLGYLNRTANDFLVENYNLKLRIPILINNRLKATLGRFCYNKKGEALSIELSSDLIKYGHPYHKLDTLKHELIHYALFEKGIPNSDNDIEFISELKRLKVGATDEVFIGMTHLINCRNCSRTYEVYYKSQAINKYGSAKTACCKSTYDYIGECIYNGFSKEDKLFSMI